MRRGAAVWKLDSVSLASRKRLLSWRSISVRSVSSEGSLLRPLRTFFRGTPGLMPKQGWAMGSTLRRLATARARVWPLKTRGWQKMFMRRASELLAESSSRHCQSLRARERRDAVWGLVRRRSQAGLAQMVAADKEGKLPWRPCSSRPKKGTGSEPGAMSWRRFWVRARCSARALKSRRRREADQDGGLGLGIVAGSLCGYCSIDEFLGDCSRQRRKQVLRFAKDDNQKTVRLTLIEEVGYG